MADYPAKLQFLFIPYRYKISYGGRGSAKSWSYARALLQQGVSKKLRILCTREVQKSIKDSVHKLLADQIELMGYSGEYEVLETMIRGRNGTEFLFAGLSSQTAESIKSFEGVDITWCEEAQTISKKSWDVLIPTIRKDGSEIWITFNPVLDTDETYTRFVTTPPPGSHVAFINYHDNPWFPIILEAERIHCKATAPDDYDNIWEGCCRSAVAGAIYAKQMAIATIEQRVTFLPYDPQLKVHTIWDLGYADNMVVLFAQRGRQEVRVIDYEQQSGSTTEAMVARVKTRPYNFGRFFLPHDGFNHDRRSSCGKSDAEILKALGCVVKRIPKTSVEDRIKNGRSQFHRFVFDREKTLELIECLKRYRRADSKQDIDTAPVHDEFSHGADGYGYAAQVIDEMSDDAEEGYSPKFDTFTPFNSGMGY